MGKMTKEKEAKLLKKYEAAAAKPKPKNYLIGLVIILTVVYIVDELASAMNSTIRPYMILDLFKVPNGDVLSPEYSHAMGILTIATYISYVFMLIAPFYKSLADKWGRRIFLIINTTVMGLGMFVMMFSPNYIVYIIGVLMVLFVQSNDMQVMYIIETAPPQHRAKICNATKAIALMGVSLIGVFKTMFYDPANLSSWRMIILIPAIAGVVIGLICIPLVKESPVFLEQRIDYLKKTDEEREAERIAKEKEENASKVEQKAGVINALKFIFTNKQLRSIMLAGIVFAMSTGICSNNTTILEAANGTGAINMAQVNAILIIAPFVNGIMTFICGFISDAVGRKKACIIYSIIATIGALGFTMGARFGLGIWVISICYGIFVGTLWSVTDTLVLVMPAESTPTDMRASVMGVMSLILNAAIAISMLVFVVGLNVFGAANLGLFGAIICVPFMAISCILLARLKETKGADLSKLTT